MGAKKNPAKNIGWKSTPKKQKALLQDLEKTAKNILPALEDVELTDIFKFKNLNDSTLKGLFVPVVGEKIENQTEIDTK